MKGGDQPVSPPYTRLGLAAAAALVACSEDPMGPPDIPDVVAYHGAVVETTPEGVTVDGSTLIDFGDGVRALFVQESTRYRYGGVHETNDDRLWDISWYLDLQRRRTVDERADTTFLSGVDFGEVVLESAAAIRVEDPGPIVYDADEGVEVLEPHLQFRANIYARIYRMDGTSQATIHEPAFDRLAVGEPMALSASGSDDVDPVSTDISVTPGARIASLDNGGVLDFQTELPLLRHDQPLVIELDREVDPDLTLVHLAYIPAPGSQVSEEDALAASAAFGLTGRTRRIVISADALADIAANLPEELGSFVLRLSEYVVQDDVVDVRYGDGVEEAYSLLRASHLRVNVRMGR